MSVHRIIQGEYIFDLTPSVLLDGRFVANATITRHGHSHVEDLWPELGPFATEAEAASAAHKAALTFIGHAPIPRLLPFSARDPLATAPGTVL